MGLYLRWKHILWRGSSYWHWKFEKPLSKVLNLTSTRPLSSPETLQALIEEHSKQKQAHVDALYLYNDTLLMDPFQWNHQWYIHISSSSEHPWLKTTWQRNQANAWELTVHFLPRWLKSTSFSCCVRRTEPTLLGLLVEGGPLILTIRWCELVIRKC